MATGQAVPGPAWWRLLLAAMLTVVAWASLMPISGPQLFAMEDKVLHVGAYVGFYLLAWLSFPGRVLQWKLHGALFAYGVAIELLQGLTSYRSMEAMDLLADATGLGLGCLVLSLWPGRTRLIGAAVDAQNL